MEFGYDSLFGYVNCTSWNFGDNVYFDVLFEVIMVLIPEYHNGLCAKYVDKKTNILVDLLYSLHF